MTDSIDRLSAALGSQRALAEALGVVPSAVSTWRRSGIPDAQKWRLLVLARARGLDLTPEDLGLPPAPNAAARPKNLSSVLCPLPSENAA